MPELPEVDTVRRGLVKAVLKKKITGVEIRNPGLRYPAPVEKLQKMVPGATIIAVGRRAKYLLLKLNTGIIIIVHLGMSGRFLLAAANAELNKHDHIIFSLDCGEQLRFRDPRRFGMIDVIHLNELAGYHRFLHLGVEPFSDNFTSEYCISKVGNSKRPIKNTLIDSSFVAGLGNIYANEALFLAKTHPLRPTKSLTRTEWQELVKSIRLILTRAIEQGGTTLLDEGFRNLLGMGGEFQISLSVYGKTGKPCPNCGSPIRRIVQTGRSSFFCPQCQQ